MQLTFKLGDGGHFAPHTGQLNVGQQCIKFDIFSRAATATTNAAVKNWFPMFLERCSHDYTWTLYISIVANMLRTIHTVQYMNAHEYACCCQ